MPRLAPLLLLAALAAPAAAVRTLPGDVVSTDFEAQIWATDPAGEIDLVAFDFLSGRDFQGLVEDVDGTLLATQGASGSVYRVFPAVEGLSLVATPQLDLGLTLIFPIDVELGAAGEILVLDAGPAPPVGVAALGAVFEVEDNGMNDGQGTQTVLALNGYLADVLQLAAHPNGLLYATSVNTTAECLPLPGGGTPDPDAPPSGAVVEIDPNVAIDPDAEDFDPCVNQRVLARDGPLRNPTGIAVDADGKLVVASLGDPADIDDQRLVLVDPADDSMIILSEGGPLLCEPQQIAVEADGRIVVADVGIGAIVQVDPTQEATSNQSLLTPQQKPCEPPPVNAGDPVTPDDPFGPIGIAVVAVPEPSARLLAACALALAAALGHLPRRARRPSPPPGRRAG